MSLVKSEALKIHGLAKYFPGEGKEPCNTLAKTNASQAIYSDRPGALFPTSCKSIFFW